MVKAIFQMTTIDMIIKTTKAIITTITKLTIVTII